MPRPTHTWWAGSTGLSYPALHCQKEVGVYLWIWLFPHLAINSCLELRLKSYLIRKTNRQTIRKPEEIWYIFRYLNILQVSRLGFENQLPTSGERLISRLWSHSGFLSSPVNLSVFYTKQRNFSRKSMARPFSKPCSQRQHSVLKLGESTFKSCSKFS